MTRHSALSETAVFVIAVFFSSCATLLNGPAQNIRIATDEKIRRVSMENTLFIDSSAREPAAPGTYLVRRSHETLVIHVQLDSGEKIIRIRPHSSFAYWLNIDKYGIGMLIDKDRPKRYAYRCWSYLALKDTTIMLRRFAPVPMGKAAYLVIILAKDITRQDTFFLAVSGTTMSSAASIWVTGSAFQIFTGRKLLMAIR